MRTMIATITSAINHHSLINPQSDDLGMVAIGIGAATAVTGAATGVTTAGAGVAIVIVMKRCIWYGIINYRGKKMFSLLYKTMRVESPLCGDSFNLYKG